MPRFLGSIPSGVTSAHLRILGFVAFAMLFENYDLGLIAAALPQIREAFGLSETQAGNLLGAIELGALVAFLLVPLADRFGRRRLLLACVIGMSVSALLTALAPNVHAFAVAQVLTRSFAATATVVSFVIVAEEFPAEHRGWGIGMLGAVGAAGFGLGAAVYSQVERLPYGWRAVYGIGALALLLLPLFRRGIAETRRFRESQAGRTSRGSPLAETLRPLVQLAVRYPARAALLGLAIWLATAGHRPALRFVSDFVQQVHGWSPSDYALLTVGGGLLGVLGNPVAGVLGDRFGRRQLGALVMLPFPLVASLFYLGPGAALVAPWIAMVFLAMASNTILRALATELFPTEMRSSAGGLGLLGETLGASTGLFLFAGLNAHVDGRGVALSLVSCAAALAAFFLLFLPDTHRRELEAIASDRPAGD